MTLINSVLFKQVQPAGNVDPGSEIGVVEDVGGAGDASEVGLAVTVEFAHGELNERTGNVGPRADSVVEALRHAW
jgi:hypothetical protein